MTPPRRPGAEPDADRRRAHGVAFDHLVVRRSGGRTRPDAAAPDALVKAID